jgi:hypothetical protein
MRAGTTERGVQVSGATYRIISDHDPVAHDGLQWSARIYGLADESGIAQFTTYGPTQSEAELRAREWVDMQTHKRPGRTFYVFDDGTDAPEPDTHSVKA